MLLPPALFLCMAFVGLLAWKRSWGRMLAFIGFISIWLLSLAPVRDLLLWPLEEAYDPLPVEQADASRGQAIVLLGGGLYEHAPEFGGEDALEKYALMRTVYAAELAKKTGLDVYASGGVVFSGQDTPEGEVMVRWLARFGVPQERLHAENAARTTWENALRLRDMLEQRGIQRVMLVTSAYHMPRAVRAFRAQGFDVLPAPSAYRKSKDSSYAIRDWLPRADVFHDACNALHEYLGMLWYFWRYSMA
ncbi:MAG: YdcF family protein [Zetaproteobacteria bacterium]|nr:MAG: YdcF family protein [Zetaproteobacteria bacterium]